MKKIIFILAVAGLLFTSCEPQIVEKVVEVDTSATPDSLKLFMANVPQEYTQAMDTLLAHCDVVIVSYGKNLAFKTNSWGITQLPDNFVTLVGYTYNNGNLEFTQVGSFSGVFHFSVALPGWLVDDLYAKGGYLYQTWDATPENFNTHLYGGDQYVYDIISH